MYYFRESRIRDSSRNNWGGKSLTWTQWWHHSFNNGTRASDHLMTGADCTPAKLHGTPKPIRTRVCVRCYAGKEDFGKNRRRKMRGKKTQESMTKTLIRETPNKCSHNSLAIEMFGVKIRKAIKAGMECQVKETQIKGWIDAETLNKPHKSHPPEIPPIHLCPL